jgi:NADH dehydrogenase
MIETVFVTGGSSTLGQHVLRKLTSHFHVLAVVHRHNVEIPDAEIELLHGGLEETVRNPRALRRAHVVLHMAAVTHADDAAEYLRVNAELTKQFVSACSPSQHFIYVSTICAHPDGGAYGRSKWLAEEAIRDSRLDHTIIRPSEIYGSRDGEGIDALIGLARKAHILPDFRYGGSVKYAPISIQEAAHFIAEATIYRRQKERTYTLCADRLCTTPEIARALRSSVRPLFAIPVPIMMLRAAKALGLPVPFTRDQIDRLILPKAYDSMLARLDYDFQPQCFLDYLTQSGNDSAHGSPAMTD